MSIPMLILALVACGGEAKKEAAPPPTPPKPPVAAKPPEAPPVAPPPPAADVATPGGPYVPDEFAKAAYKAAEDAGAAKTTKNPKAGDAAAITAGKAKYDLVCASCHGATGAGDGIVGTALPQKPANFRDKSRWDASPVGTKHWIILNGVKGTSMAPLGLSEDEAWSVLAYIESEFVGK